MDVRVYFEKVRQVEATIDAPFVIVISLETGDGGVAGTVCEVSRRQAAKLIVEHRVRLATAEESADFCARQDEMRQAAEEELASSRVQVSVISDSDLRELRAKRQK